MKQPSPTSPKKPYQRPLLLVYGRLTDMTRSTNAQGQPDGGVIIGMRRTA